MIVTMGQTTERYKLLADVLGKSNVTHRLDSPFDFITIASKGMSSTAIKHFSDYFELNRVITAHFLNISEPTLYRWVKSKKDLERNFSVQLFEISDVFLYGIEVFNNSKESFFKWLNLPNTALGGIEPQELIEIPGGVSKVRDLLGRIEHGVFS